MDSGIFLPANQLSDAELARAGRSGDVHSLGLLLERYRPRLYASALALTGHRPEAEDAVHDTFVTALVRLQELRDHASVGGWLHAILRNNCLMAMRRNRQRAGPEETEICFRALKEEALVESRIESRQLRDWIWAVLEQLPEAQRVTVMLRYFGSHDSYDELAAILSVPVGTVRSRLSEAKIKLATLLRDAANIADSRPKQVLAEREAFYAEAFQSLNRGDRDSFLGHYADDLQLLCSGIEQRLGHAEFAAEVDDGLYAGVRTDLIRVLASGDLTVLEGAFVNPPENPLHCPPGIVLVLFQRDGFVRRVHLHLTPRPPLPAA